MRHCGVKRGVFAAASIILLILAGCNTVKHDELSAQADQVVVDYEALLSQFDRKQTVALPQSKRLEIKHAQEFLYRELPADYSRLAFRKVLSNLFPGTPIVYDASIPMSYNPAVIAPPGIFTVIDHLDAISLQTNLGWSAKKGVVYISPNQVVHYPIPIYGAKDIMRDISLSTNNLSDSANSSSFRNNLRGEISVHDELTGLASSIAGARPCYDEQEVEKFETLQTVGEDSIVAPMPCFSFSGAGNVLIVSARPQAHALFVDAYEPWFASANIQVQITLKVLQMDITDLSQQALDPSLIRSAAISAAGSASSFGGFGFEALSRSQNFVSFDESSNGLTFRFGEGSRYAGSNLIIQALNQVGKTYVSEVDEFTVRNNQLHSVFFEEETPFLKSVSIAITAINSNSNQVAVAPTLESDVTITGNALNIMTTVTGNEIGLRIDIDNKILGKREDYELSAANTKLVGSRYGSSSTNLTFNPTLNDGDAVLLVSSARKTFDIDNANNDFLPVIGDLYSAKRRIFNTLYLIEAHILR